MSVTVSPVMILSWKHSWKGSSENRDEVQNCLWVETTMQLKKIKISVEDSGFHLIQKALIFNKVETGTLKNHKGRPNRYFKNVTRYNDVRLSMIGK